MLRIRRLLRLATLAAVLGYAAPLLAQTIIDEWPSVKAPPAPGLKAVTLDPKTTALLVMDLVKQTCNNERRPRCVASIPKIEKLIAEARAHGVTVDLHHGAIGPHRRYLPAVAPKGNDPVVAAAVDKFILGNQDTGLEKMLKDKRNHLGHYRRDRSAWRGALHRERGGVAWLQCDRAG